MLTGSFPLMGKELTKFVYLLVVTSSASLPLPIRGYGPAMILLLRCVFQDEGRELNHKPSEPGILVNQRVNVFGVIAVPK